MEWNAEITQNFTDSLLKFLQGFKVSVEHHLRGLAVGETLENDAYETFKEAAGFLYQQYLSQEVNSFISIR